MRGEALSPRKTCPHCGITAGVNVLARWHNDNCKYRHSPLQHKIGDKVRHLQTGEAGTVTNINPTKGYEVLYNENTEEQYTGWTLSPFLEPRTVPSESRYTAKPYYLILHS